MEDSKIMFVAVGKVLGNYRSTLEWVLENQIMQRFKGWKIWIIYVHIPSQMILDMRTGVEVHASLAPEQDLANFRERERLEMHATVDSYVKECGNITGENFKGIAHIANSIEQGIVEVISQYRARRLIMGAGQSREMTKLTSTKANYVRQHAPNYCQLQFIYNGELILTREGVETPDVLGINEPDPRPESSNSASLYDQLEQAISKTGYSIRLQKAEIEDICQKYLAEEGKKLLRFSYISTTDVREATFNYQMIIGEGGFGLVYKGLLDGSEVAIKVLNDNSKQGLKEFQQEIDALRNLRHPNLVTLVGACIESRALVYGYLHGGNLEDRLSCKGNRSPLHWQTRIRIATELCSVLVFLHNRSPNSIIHGDLKPSNILLDENLVCKLSDFGICHISSRTQEDITSFLMTVVQGTKFYMDPEFLTTGKLSRKSDVYSVGVILLRLLTGEPAPNIANKVRNAMKRGTLTSILDPSAGEWPSTQANELAAVSVLCCEMRRKDRPDLIKVLRFLKLIKASLIGLSKHDHLFHAEPPTHFLCPIFQEIMQDPHLAADGHTYEKEAIIGWLEGHDSSPITKETLQHGNITPNRALNSIIQEWLKHNHTP